MAEDVSKKENNDIPIADSVTPRSIEGEMKRAYLSYSMSVIAGRALPDARDGLKPVQRRILYTMLELGLLPNRPFKKSATIVGNVMAKYHPHGDSSIYEALVRLAQSFSMRYPLINGQGNFGSVDGDSAAAMRYTEAKLTQAGLLLLQDIDKDTVDFMDNFDGSAKEPMVLPSMIPNLLINGTSGIAVGMATNIPPHNAIEVIEAIKAKIDNPDITLSEIMGYIKGPDFPTGAEIVNSAALQQGYTAGRTQIRIRSRWHYEEHSNRKWLVVTEIPYQVNKSSLIEEIAEGVKNEMILGVHDLRDESDKEGTRVVIELKKDVNTELLENQLLKYTRLETSFSMMLTALEGTQPKTFSLPELLQSFIDHRFEVVTRRTNYELAKAEERQHILEGLIVALNDIDNVIAKIKKSKNAAEAKAELISSYDLSDRQVAAILDMRLQKLSALESQQIRDEHEALSVQIQDYKKILSDPNEIFKIIKDELEGTKQHLKGDRKTVMSDKVVADIDEEKLIEEHTAVVTITKKGYAKRISLDEYRVQNRGGRGLTGAGTRDGDFVEDVFVCSSHDYLLLFSDRGQLYWLKVYKIPEGSRTSLGRPLVNMVSLGSEERITATIAVKGFDENRFLFFVTRKGTVKRTPLNAFSNIRVTGVRAITIDGDELVDVKLTDGKDKILLGTAKGKSIRFDENDVRAMGRTAYGVRGIRLAEGYYVVGAAQESEGKDVLTIKQNGLGKRTSFEKYRLQNRGGSGIINIKTRGSPVIGVRAVNNDSGIIVITKQGIIIRTRATSISQVGRAATGVRVIRVGKEDYAVSFSVVPPEEIDEEEAEKAAVEAKEAAKEDPITTEENLEDENMEDDTADDEPEEDDA